jgi:hypothetical protein
MINAPEKMPAPPTPAMALPAIKTAEELAAPQINEPISKMMMLTRKVYLTERMLYSLPKGSWNAAVVRRYLCKVRHSACISLL